jgi:hypothetical protein
MKETKSMIPYLEETFPFEASKLVGKCLKRFEIIDDKELLKKEVKELIYESFRDIINIVAAYEKGLENSHFVFKNGKEK